MMTWTLILMLGTSVWEVRLPYPSEALCNSSGRMWQIEAEKHASVSNIKGYHARWVCLPQVAQVQARPS